MPVTLVNVALLPTIKLVCKFNERTLPLISKLPPVDKLPRTDSCVSSPTLVILGCAAVTTVPLRLLKSPVVPLTLPADALPVTDKAVSVPTAVMFV